MTAIAPWTSVEPGYPRKEHVAAAERPEQMLYSLLPPVSVASSWPRPEGDAEATLSNDCITPAPVSANPTRTDEPATSITARLNFDLRLLIATALLSLRALGALTQRGHPRRLNATCECCTSTYPLAPNSSHRSRSVHALPLAARIGLNITFSDSLATISGTNISSTVKSLVKCVPEPGVGVITATAL